MTKHLSNIESLRDMMNTLYPYVRMYYKTRDVIKSLEADN